MKRYSNRRKVSKFAGFTLVELLVVIAIIAILAGVLLLAAGQALNTAKRARAQNTAVQIQTAVLGYYTEYSVYPVVSAASPTDLLFSTRTDWQPIAVCLCGGIDPGNPAGGQFGTQTIPNTRQIVYLTLNASDLDSTGTAPSVPKLPFTAPGGGVQYFQMAIDGDYSGVLGDTGTGTKPPDFSSMPAGQASLPLTTTKALAVGVAVWGNCDPNSTSTKTHPNYWIHTY